MRLDHLLSKELSWRPSFLWGVYGSPTVRNECFWVGGSGLWNIDLEPQVVWVLVFSTAFIAFVVGEWNGARMLGVGFAKEHVVGS